MTTTRQNCDVYLIGQRDLDSLGRLNQLPTVKQVLQRFHYHLSEQTKTQSAVRNASHNTVDEVLTIWSNAAVPTILKQHAIEKLEKYHSNWLFVKKNKGRVSECQRQRECEYRKEIECLFDLAHAEALGKMKIQEDKEFLVDQRSKRKMCMSVEDKKFAEKQHRVCQRKFAEEERRRRAASASVASEKVDASTLNISYSEGSSESDSSGDNFEPSQYLHRNTQEPMRTTSASKILTKHVTSALDRNKTSDREAVRLLIPVAAALGCDPASVSLSRSTVRRMRKNARKEHTESVRADFSPNCPLVVHWDGKILPEIDGVGKVDRLPVLVSGEDVNKLLGVPKLPSGTADHIASAVHEMIKEWNLAGKIQAMSFDTTAVNTGHLRGACVQLEKVLGRDLLWLACRHHIMEIMLAKVFTLCFGPSSGPDIPLFKRFKSIWNEIAHNHYQVLDVACGAEQFKETTLSYIRQLNWREMELRDDYKELAELTLVVLGSPSEEIHWRMPGPIHNARWMAKLLYAIKIYLFREHRNAFKLTKKDEQAVQRFVHFGVLLYTRCWMKAALAAEAPGEDLQLWKDLDKYQIFDAEISLAARTVLNHHLWYLSDELVGLAIFSDTVTLEEKGKIVAGFKRKPGDRNVRGNPATLSCNARLGDFASSRTANLFIKLNLSDSFLALPPQDWCHDEGYCRAREQVKALLVVNDTAERAVKLFEEYNSLITKDEEEKQLLLQLVEANRKAIPTETTKQAAIAAMLN